LAFLQAHQCDEAQGYYFSPPVIAQQFAELIATGPVQSTVKQRAEPVFFEPEPLIVHETIPLKHGRQVALEKSGKRP
jgi:hypothetical protein